MKPRGIAHAFWNAGDEDGRLLEIISPAGFGDYSRALAPLLAASESNPEAIGNVRQRFELDLDFDSVPTLISRHGLRTR